MKSEGRRVQFPQNPSKGHTKYAPDVNSGQGYEEDEYDPHRYDEDEHFDQDSFYQESDYAEYFRPEGEEDYVFAAQQSNHNIIRNQNSSVQNRYDGRPYPPHLLARSVKDVTLSLNAGGGNSVQPVELVGGMWNHIVCINVRHAS